MNYRTVRLCYVQIAALRYIPTSMSWTSFALVFGLAAASVLAAVYLSSKK